MAILNDRRGRVICGLHRINLISIRKLSDLMNRLLFVANDLFASDFSVTIRMTATILRTGKNAVSLNCFQWSSVRRAAIHCSTKDMDAIAVSWAVDGRWMASIGMTAIVDDSLDSKDSISTW